MWGTSCAYLEGSCRVGWSATRATFDVLGGTFLAPPQVPVAAQIVPVEGFVVVPVQYRNMCSPVANFFTATGQQFPQENYVLKRLHVFNGLHPKPHLREA
jgi:hypothetical protein